jgi:hypothetical protein
VLVPDGVDATIGSAAGAATLALRLRELDPEIELAAASWLLMDAPPGELQLADT